MPTYEYACRSCDHRFEVVQSFSEDALATCPSCDRDELRKVYNAAGIIFKGDGWHIKDYAARPRTSATASDATAKDGSGDGASSKDSGAPKKKERTGKGGSSKEGGSSSATKAAS